MSVSRSYEQQEAIIKRLRETLRNARRYIGSRTSRFVSEEYSAIEREITNALADSALKGK